MFCYVCFQSDTLSGHYVLFTCVLFWEKGIERGRGVLKKKFGGFQFFGLSFFLYVGVCVCGCLLFFLCLILASVFCVTVSNSSIVCAQECLELFFVAVVVYIELSYLSSPSLVNRFVRVLCCVVCV